MVDDRNQAKIMDFGLARMTGGTLITKEGMTMGTIAYMSPEHQQAGDYDLTIDWFEKAYEEHEPNLPFISSPYADPLRSYPRFLDLLRKMNLPVDEKE